MAVIARRAKREASPARVTFSAPRHTVGSPGLSAKDRADLKQEQPCSSVSQEQRRKALGDELLDTEQAAAAYGLSQSTLRKWRCIGEGPRFTRIGRAVRYRQSELQAFIEGRTFTSTAQADAG